MTYLDPRSRDFTYLTRATWKSIDRFLIEKAMIRSGGKIRLKDGTVIGEGMVHHYKCAMSALWPWFDWNRWSHLLIESYVNHNEVAVLGPASSGKSFCAAAYALTNFFLWPRGTSIMMSSTTKDMLELRVWGEVKKLFNDAKRRRQYLPGRMLQSRTMLTGADSDDEAQDFRDGILGVACRVGGVWVGISNYIGVKNDRMYLIADEASLMGRGFLDALSNLRKGAKERFQFICMGNPKDPTDALGTAAEPHQSIGGWSGYSGEAKTQTWMTRAGGLAIQLCGYDSPNYDHPRGSNPHPGIIKPEDIEKDLSYYGESSLQFSMMNLGIMPKDGSSRRVLTMQLAEQRFAFDDVTWEGQLTHIVGLDAAYKGVGGDRAPLTHLAFGKAIGGKEIIAFMGPQVICPIDPTSTITPEDQLALFMRDYCVQRGIPPQNAGIDSTGRGTLVSSLAKLWSPEIVAVEFGGKPTDRKIRDGDPKTESEAYGKMVSSLWFASYYVVESGQLRLCPREAMEEACLREWGMSKKTGTNRQDPVIDVEPKEKTKQRMGRSPDLWDSLVVALEIARRRGFRIAAGHAGVAVSSRKMPTWIVEASKKQREIRHGHSLVAT